MQPQLTKQFDLTDDPQVFVDLWTKYGLTPKAGQTTTYDGQTCLVGVVIVDALGPAWCRDWEYGSYPTIAASLFGVDDDTIWQVITTFDNTMRNPLWVHPDVLSESPAIRLAKAVADIVQGRV